jgi:AcrR family transcriptional regulator
MRRIRLNVSRMVGGTATSINDRVLAAAKACCDQWGFAKVTIDDIAAAADVSRATLYRLFPGGKDVLFDALRVRELEEFFTRLNTHLVGADSLEDFLVRTVVAATDELRHDDHLALMLASEPGETLSQLTVDGLPRIIRMASLFLAPQVEPYLDRDRSVRLVELLSRLVISYFLAPSQHVDLGNPDSARTFIRSHILPAFEPIPSSTGATS